MKALSYWPVLLAPALVAAFQFVIHGSLGTAESRVRIEATELPPASTSAGPPATAATREEPRMRDREHGSSLAEAPAAGSPATARPGPAEEPFFASLLSVLEHLEKALLEGDEASATQWTEELRVRVALDPRCGWELLRLLEGGRAFARPLHDRLVRILYFAEDPDLRAAICDFVAERERTRIEEAARDLEAVVERLDPDTEPATLLDTLEGLGGAALADPQVQSKLRTIARSARDDKVRCLALYRLAAQPGDETDDLLAGILEGEADGPVRLAAIRALAESGSALAAELEMRILADPIEYPPTRSFAAKGLARHPGHLGVTEILEDAFWREFDPTIRRSAIESLITLGRTDATAQAAVTRILLEAQEPEFRERAARGLEVGGLPGESLAAWETALALESSDSVRNVLLAALDRTN